MVVIPCCLSKYPWLAMSTDFLLKRARTMCLPVSFNPRKRVLTALVMLLQYEDLATIGCKNNRLLGLNVQEF